MKGSMQRPMGGRPRPRLVPCPACRQAAVYGPENPSRPFCSLRCKSLDFGAWASEGYRLPASAEPDDPAADDSDGPGANH